ncbi:MAG: hypothetical protein FJZ11_00615 [Candidatus Omnitrophica bacterium]|nr:hypothetical protein [Candidatus Omnitrophota bacterium]
MTLKQIDKEFKVIKSEIYKRPQVETPYPKEIVSRRELLLFAQVQLSKIIRAKQSKNIKEELFYTELYETTIRHYFDWN